MCNLVGMVLNAVDGTKIMADSSNEKLALHRGKLEGMLKGLDEAIDEVFRVGEGENLTSFTITLWWIRCVSSLH